MVTIHHGFHSNLNPPDRYKSTLPIFYAIGLCVPILLHYKRPTRNLLNRRDFIPKPRCSATLMRQRPIVTARCINDERNMQLRYILHNVTHLLL